MQVHEKPGVAVFKFRVVLDDGRAYSGTFATESSAEALQTVGGRIVEKFGQGAADHIATYRMAKAEVKDSERVFDPAVAAQKKAEREAKDSANGRIAAPVAAPAPGLSGKQKIR